MIKLSGLELGRDIQIVFSGLREGEKLYEELLNNQENTLPTHHEKIMIAKVREKKFIEIEKQISELRPLIKQGDDLALVRAMKDIVPEFISNASRFTVLDQEYALNQV